MKTPAEARLRKPSPRHPRRRWATALLAAALASATLPATPQVRLPALGDSASEDLPVAAERRYGEQVMRELRRDPDFLDDATLLDYAQSLWRPLLAAARQRGDIGPEIDTAFSWELFLVRDRSVNAFALPGGHVGVHLGLVAATATADELASVLAHELSHVAQRHIARSLGNAGRQGAVGVAAMLLGVLIASRAQNADMANAAIAGSQAAIAQGQLNFSRDMEREADRIGFGILAGAGFAPQGMAGMFDRLEQAARLNDGGAFPYLRSHPLTGERLAEARGRLTGLPPAQVPATGSAAPARWLHALMQGRARVLMEPNAAAWQRLVELGRQAAARAGEPAGPESASALYAGALAAARRADHEQARVLAGHLARSVAQASAAPWADQQNPALGLREVLELLQAELALARGQTREAWHWLDSGAGAAQASAQTRDGNGAGTSPAWARSRLSLRAQVALAGDRAEPANSAELREALEALQVWVAAHPQDEVVWALLARTADALGLRLRALRAQAESLAVRGDLGAAIDVLRRAQAGSRAAAGSDLIEASVIDARLRAFEARRRQQMAEAREAAGRGRGGGRSDPPNEERDPGR